MTWNTDRRDFLRVLAAGSAVGAMTACNQRPWYPKDPRRQYLHSPVHQSPEQTPEVSLHYATTCRECPAGCGVLARTREGRVVKVEGNPDQPLSAGTLCARGQAGLMGLYNPDRLGTPLERGPDGRLVETTWEAALARLQAEIGRLMEAGKGDAIAWLTGEISDSDADLIALFSEGVGARAPVNLRLGSEAALAKAANALFGFEGVPEFHLEDATLLVSVNADFLEAWHHQVPQIVGFTEMHAYRDGARGAAVYVGPRQSMTAEKCDSWIQIPPGRETAALRVLCEGILSRSRSSEVGAARMLLQSMPVVDAEREVGDAARGLRRLGERLAAADGPLVLTSDWGPSGETAQALALLATHLAGGSGRTVRFPKPARTPRGGAMADVKRLLDDARSSAVQALLIHSANPAFLLPETAEALEAAPFVAYFGTQHDETADRADLVLPLDHSYETWGTHSASASVVSLMQPVMLPVPKQLPRWQPYPTGARQFDSRPFPDLLLQVDARLPRRAMPNVPFANAEEYFIQRVLTYLRMHPDTLPAGQTPETYVHEAKRLGVLVLDVPDLSVALRATSPLSAPVAPASASGGELLAWFFPHPYLCDGRHADKPLLQEVPESTTAAVWGSWAELHPTTARALGVGQGDAVSLATADGKKISTPVIVTPQVLPGVVAVPIGQGHTKLGRWATDRGVNPLRLTPIAADGQALTLSGLVVTAIAVPGGGEDLVRTTGSQSEHGRHLVKTIALGEIQRAEREPAPEITMYDDYRYPDHMWGMVIDLDACVGCGACVAACHVENNVPIVGQEYVREGREMSWLRIEKYYTEDKSRFLLNICQQCSHAPCEPVCPVHAAYHTTEGLNGQIYNRCVGTRYCSNNCPYKVRRFNWFDYVLPEPLNLMYNPDVTVRERGVMEKCTFCMQRIRVGKEAAKRDADPKTGVARPIRDGEIRTACQQTCPAQAIHFGDLKRPDHHMTDLFMHDRRSYLLLEEVGTRPSVRYLKAVIRPEPENETE